MTTDRKGSMFYAAVFKIEKMKKYLCIYKGIKEVVLSRFDFVSKIPTNSLCNLYSSECRCIHLSNSPTNKAKL